ncbi:MAG: BrnT family toxin [Planctomycetota bacterium]|jgi:uncharacterized DUF497 family protein
MIELSFDWDSKKGTANFRKHGVSFEEAQSVFFDENAEQYWDEDHSEKEDRFLMVGMSYKFRVLLVVHCYCEKDTAIRIISARKATKKEQSDYFRG